MSLYINFDLLKKASQKNILSLGQANQLWLFLQEETKESKSFTFTNILYYFGGIIAIAAMTLFMNLGFEKFGGFAVLSIALIYAFIGIIITQILLSKKLNIPAGITITFVAFMTPIALYGFLKGMGWWPADALFLYDHPAGNLWIVLELGTLLVAGFLFYIYRNSFLLFPLTISLWFLCIDTTPLLFLIPTSVELVRNVSIVFGTVIILLALFFDLKNTEAEVKEDYAFHLYFWGVISFWFGITQWNPSSEWLQFVYCIINIFLIILGSILSRVIFVIFGALGLMIYLMHIAYDLFKGSFLFPIVLTFIGLLIIFLGVLWNRQGEVISKKLRSYLPLSVQRVLERKISKQSH